MRRLRYRVRLTAHGGTGPLPQPATHKILPLGGPVGERAGAAWKRAFSRVFKRALTALLLLAPVAALADSNLPPAHYAYTQLPDPRQEAAAKALMAELRCLVCQGQSIADSDAELAGDMRALVRERIAKGETPRQIRTWLIQRYGDYVTYDPPFDAATAPLWIAPLVLLVAGIWLARRSFKRRRRAA
jgi:cytochrome c-type biogenesis protein CcmH